MEGEFRLHKDWKKNLRALTPAVLHHLGPMVSDAAKTAAPILTGELVASIGFEVDESADPPVLYVANGIGGLAEDYALIQELDQPHLRPAAFRRWL